MGNKPKKFILYRGRKSPPLHALSKVYFLDGKIEIETVKHHPSNLRRYRKISSTECVDTITNKRIAFHVRDRAETKPMDLKKKFSTLRRLINNNFAGRTSELHVVLTYGGQFAGKMHDPHKLYEDYRRFWDRFKRQYPFCAYIAIAEPQQTGSWHMHVLLKDLNGNQLYVPIDQLDRLWGQGYTWVSSLEGNDNIGAYFMAYLSNLDVYENEFEKSNKKCIVKGARLSYYPPKFKLYRYSRGITKPNAEVMSYEDTKLLTEGYQPTFTQQISIVQQNEDGSERELNAIFYEHYNFIKKGQG